MTKTENSTIIFIRNIETAQAIFLWQNIKLMFMSVFAVLGKEYNGDYVPNTETLDDSKVEV